MMSSNVALLHSNNCCVLEPAICEDLDLHVVILSLLIMNSFIIHTLKNRTKNLKIDDCNNIGQGHCQGQSQGQSQGQGTKMKGSEKQVFAILLLVTFGFLILSTPMYVYFTLNLFINFTASPKIFAINHLITNIAQKLHYTNHGINFFFYVISGQKFRSDLIKLFKREGAESNLTMKPLSIRSDTETF